MTIEFSLTNRQRDLASMIHQFAQGIVRPQSLAWDRAHGVPHDFLRQIVMMMQSMGGGLSMGPSRSDNAGEQLDAEKKKKQQPALSTILSAEEMAWGDAGLLLCIPGPGLGGPPVRSSGTPEQKERFFKIFDDMSKDLKWGAYALTD